MQPKVARDIEAVHDFLLVLLGDRAAKLLSNRLAQCLAKRKEVVFLELDYLWLFLFDYWGLHMAVLQFF